MWAVATGLEPHVSPRVGDTRMVALPFLQFLAQKKLFPLVDFLVWEFPICASVSNFAALKGLIE
jgi:hypothetical protein